jgi:hypothetical protein
VRPAGDENVQPGADEASRKRAACSVIEPMATISSIAFKNLAGSTSFWREASRRWRRLFSIGR